MEGGTPPGREVEPLPAQARLTNDPWRNMEYTAGLTLFWAPYAFRKF
jgi:hypothetical protein